MNWRATQRDSFGSLVESGVYSVGYDHPPEARDFVRSTVEGVVEGGAVSVLDCGCGTGSWLDHVAGAIEAAGAEAHCYGFDLTPAMVDVARERLATRTPAAELQEGDVLDERAYVFEDGRDRFDLVYAYDVIQQLPRADQLRGCQTMLAHVAPGGALVIFDQERNSRYGVSMAAKKLATRRLPVQLVPDFYCNARYPPLGAFARTLGAPDGYSAAILRVPDFQKRALVVRVPA